jgi:hypothetical protein
MEALHTRSRAIEGLVTGSLGEIVKEVFRPIAASKKKKTAKKSTAKKTAVRTGQKSAVSSTSKNIVRKANDAASKGSSAKLESKRAHRARQELKEKQWLRVVEENL